MADASSPTPGMGGARIAGVRSSSTQDAVIRHGQAIKKAWNIHGEVEDAFPADIRPIHLGLTALDKLRAIAAREKNLAAAQIHFTNVCKNSNGAPIPFAFKHACIILDALKAGEASSLKKSKSDSKVNQTTKSGKKTGITSLETAPTPALSSITPGANLRAPFSVGKPQLASSGAVMVSGQAHGSQIPLKVNKIQDSFAAVTIPKKRGTLNFNDQITAKKSRKENKPSSPILKEHPIAEKKPINGAPMGKTNDSDVADIMGTVPQLPTSKLASAPIPGNEEDELDRKIAENRRANAIFFAGSEARQAVFIADTIRVAQPEHPQSVIQKEQFRTSASSATGHASPLATTQDWLKFYCVSLHESARTMLPSAASLHKIARPDQKYLVEQATRVIDQTINQLKTDMESVFANSASFLKF